LAPRVGPTRSLQVAAPPPPSSSVKTTLVPSLLNVAECQNAKFSVSRTVVMTLGLVRSLMSNSAPSPMQAPAARSSAGYAVMSWQPVVAEAFSSSPGLPPSGNRIGVATTAAAVGFCSGTLMIEILSCGSAQFGSDWSVRLYEEMYR
jgi:hypothetical protein